MMSVSLGTREPVIYRTNTGRAADMRIGGSVGTTGSSYVRSTTALMRAPASIHTKRSPEVPGMTGSASGSRRPLRYRALYLLPCLSAVQDDLARTVAYR